MVSQQRKRQRSVYTISNSILGEYVSEKEMVSRPFLDKILLTRLSLPITATEGHGHPPSRSHRIEGIPSVFEYLTTCHQRLLIEQQRTSIWDVSKYVRDVKRAYLKDRSIYT
jgi:hypothetical protein